MQILEQLKSLSKSLEECDNINDVTKILEEYSCKNNLENDDFLEISISLIKLKLQNLTLNEKMRKSIEFHDAMKNIAKIIETQYELNYIIPIIGEIIDKLISNQLIYIFLKENGKLKLEWPSACNDTRIKELIVQITAKSGYTITEDQKIGIFPLVNENTLLGAIASKSMENTINKEDISYLEQIASQTSTTINRANVYAEILKHATLDALTGFYNRRQLEERIKQEISSAKRQKTSLCAIMIDIDYFKQVNDTYGHAAGDLVLKTVSKIIRSQLREYDIAGRYGGEEFAILLPFTQEDEAVMVAERLRKAVANKVIDLTKVNSESENRNIQVTISLGVYKYIGKDNELLKNADKALYEAKAKGRNQVILYKS